MKAAVVKPGGTLAYEEVADPSTGVRDVLVRVRGASLNRGDLSRTVSGPPQGHEGPYVVGWDIAGEVVEVGAGVGMPRVGDRVVARVLEGGYAELAAVPAHLCVSLPPQLSYEEAASLPVAFLTAWVALRHTAKLQADDIALVHAAGSGVGMAGVQIAKRVCHAPVITTVGSPEKVEQAEALGADHVFTYGDFVERALATTGGRGVDVGLDMIGGYVFSDTQRTMANGGRLVSVGRASGDAPEVDAEAAAHMGLDVRTGWRLSDERTREEAAEDLAQIVALVAEGTLQVLVDRVFPLSQAEEAQGYLERRANFGKVVLRP